MRVPDLYAHSNWEGVQMLTKTVLLECIKIKESKDINDKEGLAEAYNTLGYIYIQLNENKKVKEFYEKSISLAKHFFRKIVLF